MTCKYSSILKGLALLAVLELTFIQDMVTKAFML